MDQLFQNADKILFYVAAGLAVVSALVVIGQKNPIYSAFGLIVTLCSLSVIFGLLGSPFIAALQVIVYAGAIMVLFLFVLMLLNAKREEDVPGRGGKALAVIASALVGVMLAQAGAVLLRFEPGAAANYDASTRAMAGILFSPHFAYVFEATSILILAAIVGAIALAKKDF